MARATWICHFFLFVFPFWAKVQSRRKMQWETAFGTHPQHFSCSSGQVFVLVVVVIANVVVVVLGCCSSLLFLPTSLKLQPTTPRQCNNY